MSANTIPDDVMRAASKFTAECYQPSTGTWFDVRDVIARAILAERKRCAEIGRHRVRLVRELAPNAGHALLEALPDAILNPPSAASSRAEQTGEAVPPLASSPVTHSGWISWSGGKCPVSAGTTTGIMFRSGIMCVTGNPENYAWLQDDMCDNVIAYRVVPNLTHEEAQ